MKFDWLRKKSLIKKIGRAQSLYEVYRAIELELSGQCNLAPEWEDDIITAAIPLLRSADDLESLSSYLTNGGRNKLVNAYLQQQEKISIGAARILNRIADIHYEPENAGGIERWSSNGCCVRSALLEKANVLASLDTQMSLETLAGFVRGLPLLEYEAQSMRMNELIGLIIPLLKSERDLAEFIDARLHLSAPLNLLFISRLVAAYAEQRGVSNLFNGVALLEQLEGSDPDIRKVGWVVVRHMVPLLEKSEGKEIEEIDAPLFIRLANAFVPFFSEDNQQESEILFQRLLRIGLQLAPDVIKMSLICPSMNHVFAFGLIDYYISHRALTGPGDVKVLADLISSPQYKSTKGKALVMQDLLERAAKAGMQIDQQDLSKDLIVPAPKKRNAGC